MDDELTVNLSNHTFSSNVRLFKQTDVKLKHKNFIFAKNGSGKSTFSELIQQQFKQTHDIQLFQGLEKYFAENSRLDAFALSVNAGENEKLISETEVEKLDIERKLLDVKNQLIQPDDSDVQNIYTKRNLIYEDVQSKKNEIDKFCKKAASDIKKLSDPQIAVSTYFKGDFRGEISNAKRLIPDELNNFKGTLTSKEKKVLKLNYQQVDLKSFLKVTNEVLTSKVKERTRISRLDTQNKINFAAEGLKVHAHQEGELCAFCGNPISKNTFSELDSYFSADEVKQLKDRIQKGIQKVEEQINLLEKISFSDINFYPDYKQSAKDEFKKISDTKNKVKSFFELLTQVLADKEKNLFDQQAEIEVDVPYNIETDVFNDIVEQNNKFGENLTQKKQEAKNALRYHEIKLALDDFQFDVKKSELVNAEKRQEEVQRKFDTKNDEKQQYEGAINQLNQAIEKLKPKAEKQAVKHINEKLKLLFSWYVDYKENTESGYYNIAEKDNENNVFYRGVSDLSTGEKNVIAFLYFIEKLEEVNNVSGLPKIIIVDDPMNSNDDTMQYLIITELQKLYQGKSRGKYDPNKDYFVLLTHNIHFYLNVPPHGSFRDDNRRTKYDKNNFYRLYKGDFQLITTEKDDFKTNYDAIWSELSELAKLNLPNSMLNSMRRIIETYLSFTNITQDEFYQGNEQYLKLFNVNSHGAIDPTSADAFTETPDQLVVLFHSIFKENRAGEHFDSHWKGDNIV